MSCVIFVPMSPKDSTLVPGSVAEGEKLAFRQTFSPEGNKHSDKPTHKGQRWYSNPNLSHKVVKAGETSQGSDTETDGLI